MLRVIDSPDRLPTPMLHSPRSPRSLRSLSLEACIGDTSTYFGRIPRDIVWLVDSYICEPVRADQIGSIGGCVLSVFEDIVLIRHESEISVRNMMGKVITRRDVNTDNTLASLVSREEIVLAYFHGRTYKLYNFSSHITRDLEVCNSSPPNGSIAMMISPFNDVYFDGKIYHSNSLSPFYTIQEILHSSIIKMGEDPLPSATFSGSNNIYYTVHPSPALAIAIRLTGRDFKFHGHQFSMARFVYEALDGVIYASYNNKSNYVNRDGISSSIEHAKYVRALHGYEAFMLVETAQKCATCDFPVLSFTRLRTW